MEVLNTINNNNQYHSSSSHSASLVPFLIFLLVKLCNSKTVNVALVISEGLVSPDNFEQTGILINGKFPGPSIIAEKGDLLIVHVVNLLPTGFALHLHGILQKETIDSDGAPFITQDLIPPNSTYTHTVFIGHQSGTFIYHAHTELDLVWAFGSLIVKEDEETINSTMEYVGEYNLILSQCWHVPISEILDGLKGSPFEDVPDTVSLLINGRSWGDWEEKNYYVPSSNGTTIQVDKNRNGTHSEGYEVITVKSNETYRFRVVGLGMDSMLSFSIENHTNLEIVEVDGILVDPVVSDYLQLNSAQRYSILLKMDQPIGNYWMESKMLPGPGPRNGRMILHYEGAPDPGEMRRQVFSNETDELDLDNWVLEDLHPRSNLTTGNELVYPVPQDIQQEIIITSFQKVVDSDNTTKFDINGRLHRHKGPSLLHQVLAGGNIGIDEENGVFDLPLGQGIQLVFQNRMSDEGECEQHPWHTHGHTLHVVGQGPDTYDTVVDGGIINDKVRASNGSTNVFLFRDVVTLFPAQRVENRTEGAGCGWAAVRFVTDNTGIWLVHCHITPHQIMGKWFVMYEHDGRKKLY